MQIKGKMELPAFGRLLYPRTTVFYLYKKRRIYPYVGRCQLNFKIANILHDISFCQVILCSIVSNEKIEIENSLELE